MNVCYLSRNRMNDPEGGSEAGVSATATTGSEGTGLRGRPMYISVPSGFQRVRTTPQFQWVRLLPGLRGQGHHPSWTKGQEYPVNEDYFPVIRIY